MNESYYRLQQQYDCVLVEGAGSPAEINLRKNDIANMGFAERVDCPVILIADIDRGGVFAHLVGTLDLLSDSERDRTVGFVINRFRGDMKLLESGLHWLEQRTGKPVLGVLPYLHGLHLDEEDGLNMDSANQTEHPGQDKRLKVIVPVLPRISNHTDFDPLRVHPDISFSYVRLDEKIPPSDLIILPGSKSVISDLQHLISRGWEQAIKKHLRYGGKLIGICGGYQMLGESLNDPGKIEGQTTKQTGLNLLQLSTTIKPVKQLKHTHGTLSLPGQQPCPIYGYEIHAGVTTGAGLNRPAITLSPGSSGSEGLAGSESATDGAVSEDNQIFGTYLHGVFDDRTTMDHILRWAGLEKTQSHDYQLMREDSIDRLADTIEMHLNTAHLFDLIN